MFITGDYQFTGVSQEMTRDGVQSGSLINM
jgi:hypothetical protein